MRVRCHDSDAMTQEGIDDSLGMKASGRFSPLVTERVTPFSPVETPEK